MNQEYGRRLRAKHGYTKQQIADGKIRLAFRNREQDRIEVFGNEGRAAQKTQGDDPKK